MPLLPRFRFVAYLAQYEPSDVANDVKSSAKEMKCAGGNEPEHRVTPADQGLHPDDAEVFGSDNELVGNISKLSGTHCLVQVYRQLGSGIDSGLHLLGEGHTAIPTLGLGHRESNVCTLDEIRSAGCAMGAVVELMAVKVTAR